MSETGVVKITDRHARTWPQARECLGLNPAGPDEISGIEVINEETDDTGDYTTEVTLSFASPEALDTATSRLFSQAEELFAYGAHSDAKDVQDFVGALPPTREVFNDA